MSSPAERAKAAAGEAAAREVRDGQIVGLGTGSTAACFVEALARRCREEGLTIKGVSTSTRTEELARSLGLPLLELSEATSVDILVDGADRVDPNLDMVKGGGGALLWEKMVASVAALRIYAIDDTKRTEELGRDFPVPLEVVPAGLSIVTRRLEDLGLDPVLRSGADGPYVTDSGNYILDTHLPVGARIPQWERTLVAMPGIVECGLFVGMVDLLLVGTADGVQRIEPDR